jgi:BirA family biotin operon repressor/biotin-[acetyl-CoA-carboxylase] ligase
VLRSRGPRVDGLLPIRVGLALAAGLEERSAAEVGLKWPNDLFLLGKGASAKVGGILCEKVLAVTPSSPHGAAVVVGVGLNVLPIEVPGGEPSGALASAGLGDRMTVLGCVVDAVRSAAEATGTLTAGELAAWQRRDILRDRPVQVKGPRDGGERGVARGIDQEGRLLVETRYGLAGVVAGTVRALEGSAGLSPTGAR